MQWAGVPSLHGLDRAVMVIIVSEIGDKTFLIAAILSMRHPRVTVFAGALMALALMSLLSSILGTIMPVLLPKRYTTIAAALLFFVFGGRMLKEGLEMESGTDKIEEEMREVQKEVEEAEDEVVGRAGAGGNVVFPLSDLEEGRIERDGGMSLDRAGTPANGTPPAIARSPSKPSISQRPLGAKRRSSFKASKEEVVSSLKEGTINLAHFFFSPIFIQSFILTFLAEWGDRSQITTIALAAAHNVWLVTLGTTLGHSCCTLLAVMGGRWISQHISIKHVTLGGAVLFLIFGLVYSYEAYLWVDDLPDYSLQ